MNLAILVYSQVQHARAPVVSSPRWAVCQCPPTCARETASAEPGIVSKGSSNNG